MPRSEPRVSPSISVPPPAGELAVYPRTRPLNHDEYLRIYVVDGWAFYLIVKDVTFLASTQPWPAETTMDAVMIRAITLWSKGKFYEQSHLDAIPGRLKADASRAEAQKTKKAWSTRTRNGQVVVDTETFMRHRVRQIQHMEDAATYLEDMYDEDLDAGDF